MSPEDRGSKLLILNLQLEKGFNEKNRDRACSVRAGKVEATGECTLLTGVTFRGVKLVYDRGLHFDVLTEDELQSYTSYVTDIHDLRFCDVTIRDPRGRPSGMRPTQCG